MSGRIRVLPKTVVDRIAAGEVVERPASVVKELVENSLDAGATRVDVEIRGGGRDLVAVRDDGIGIAEVDLPLAVTSHATSKLSDVGDLDHIASFGFRGEALASVASVSDFRIVSRTADCEEGYEIRVRGGEGSQVCVAPSAPGTLVEVRHLFQYVPARRKFLKTPATESTHVTQVLQRVALANPDVAFSLVRDGRVALRVAAGQERRERLAAFHGRGLAESLLEVHREDGHLIVTGLAAPPSQARRTATAYHFFVNGRPVRDRSLAHAVRHAFEGLLTVGKHPVVFLFLETDPAEVDVNVHPGKAEVRFRDAQRVHKLVRSAVRETLLGGDVAPVLAVRERAAREPDETRDRYLSGVSDALAEFLTTPGAGPRPDRGSQTGAGSEAQSGAGHGAVSSPSRQAQLPAGPARAASRYLQVGNLFLVFETDEGDVAIADQHALHERILLEEIKERVARGALEVQPLLVPAVVELPAVDVDRVEAEAEALARIGLQVDRFGPTEIAVRSLPALLSHRDPARILEGVTERLRAGKGAGDRDTLMETLMHSMACRGAIMAGDVLTETQAAELMRRADLLDNPHGCAHGRPTSLRITRRDLIRHFER